jgi:5-formyltetrahydrofolate cyclo-ligase
VKKELRRRLQAVLTSIPPAALSQRSRVAADLLFNEPEYRRAEVMMVYLSHTQEADTTRIVLQAWQDRKRILAPQVSWESKAMIPIEIRNLDIDVARNNLGLREPIEGPPIPIELIDLVIVPGLAFDGAGNRLGRGRGFYDRFLARPNFRGIACGFALETQMVDAIPAGPHDMKIDMLVTDAAVRRFAKTAGAKESCKSSSS